MTRTLAGPTWAAGRTWQPGEEIPDDVAAQITNPKAWVTDEDTDSNGRQRREPGYGGRTLAATVHVAGTAYGPGDPLTEEVALAITNPKAWADEESPTVGGRQDGDASASSSSSSRAAPAKAAPVKAAKRSGSSR